jgi:hypothetical protein
MQAEQEALFGTSACRFVFSRPVIAKDGPVIPDGRSGHRDAHAGLERLRRVQLTTRVSVLHDRAIGPRDKGPVSTTGASVASTDARVITTDAAVMDNRRCCHE